MTNTQPRNVQEALAQANRLQRAQQILKDGYTFTQDADTQMVAVCKPGELHAAYWIGEHVDGTNGCDCADRVKTQKPCKHEHAWELVKAEQADEARMWEAQCKQWEEENEELPEYDAIHILMVAELRRAERGVKNTAGTSAAAGWCERFRKCEAALQIYDEVKIKQTINFYKRIPA